MEAYKIPRSTARDDLRSAYKDLAARAVKGCESEHKVRLRARLEYLYQAAYMKVVTGAGKAADIKAALLATTSLAETYGIAPAFDLLHRRYELEDKSRKEALEAIAVQADEGEILEAILADPDLVKELRKRLGVEESTDGC